MENLQEHYCRLLGLDKTWKVEAVDLAVAERRVTIRLHYVGGRLTCLECQGDCGRADFAPERQWRHLDTMQFETVLVARVPRGNCPKCGVKTIAVAWAEKSSRFTLLFEAFAIEVAQACSSIKATAELLGLHWESVQSIMTRAVERGLQRRSVDQVHHVGIDEKSFHSGQSYISVMTDLDQSRVLEVVEDRTETATDELWTTLPPEQREKVRAVASDMWPPYVASTRTNAPKAAVVHDKFHVSKHLNEGVDQVRRRENKGLLETGDDRLKGTKQLWLYSPPNMTRAQRRAFAAIQKRGLDTSRAWAIKEQFRWFWRHVYPTSAERFFRRWYAWAIRCRLAPIVKKAKMLKRHLANLLTYFQHPITNATSEGYNSRIQSIKSAARGFRIFQHYRIRILFHCGKLDLMPQIPTH
jgi:transposase